MANRSLSPMLFLFLLLLACWPGSAINLAMAKDEVSADYVGRKVCAKCHEKEVKAWQGSDHALAMQEADNKTVLGNFDNATFDYAGMTSRFYKKKGRFYVKTDGADGKLNDYRVFYTFGHYPLQQYLIAFPDGRLQALSIAWDSRSKEQGGQRWFHLYADEKIDYRDELHWSGLQQNWNYMCADCHSTNLQRNYDLKTNHYNTTWSEINVSCEACHGPASRHVAWARKENGWQNDKDTKGLLINLDERRDVTWIADKKTGNAHRSTPRNSAREVELCARCHSRRAQIWGNNQDGKPLMDTYLPALLTERLYYPDGQILDEVYVYGSFLQSKMNHAGVTCSDCHDPHSSKLRMPGNDTCLQCHAGGKYQTEKHHHHKADSRGASCAECHMPRRTYMGVDGRRDHSMRIPRPDVSARLSTPNACSHCHKDKSASWAAKKVQQWFAHPSRGYMDFADIFYNARSGKAGSARQLMRLADNDTMPDIVRATAVYELAPYLSMQSMQTLSNALWDEAPLLRHSALSVLDRVPIKIRLKLAVHLLNDPVRIVRITAARMLVNVPADALTKQQAEQRQTALDEYIQVQLFNAERPESHINLGQLYAARREYDKAEAAYQTALKIQPRFISAYVSLADLYRLRKREDKAVGLIGKALQDMPENAMLHHTLGLVLVRQRKISEATAELGKASQLDAGNPRFAYIYAIALNSGGKVDKALLVLQAAHLKHPANRDILYALVTINRDAGNTGEARKYARLLQKLVPNDPDIRALAR